MDLILVTTFEGKIEYDKVFSKSIRLEDTECLKEVITVSKKVDSLKFTCEDSTENRDYSLNEFYKELCDIGNNNDANEWLSECKFKGYIIKEPDFSETFSFFEKCYYEFANQYDPADYATRIESFKLDKMFNEKVGKEYSVWFYGVKSISSSDSGYLHIDIVNNFIKDVISFESDASNVNIDNIYVFLHNRDMGLKFNGLLEDGECCDYIKGIELDAKSCHFFHFSHINSGVHLEIIKLKKENAKIDIRWCKKVISYIEKDRRLSKLISETDSFYDSK